MTEAEQEPVRRRMPLVILTWVWVAVPFAYGLFDLATQIPALLAG